LQTNSKFRSWHISKPSTYHRDILEQIIMSYLP
jgi:hypothetical protein